MGRSRQYLYRTPEGYYDQPFYYIYDGSNNPPALNALNQQIPIDAGWGDFILRRVVGFYNVINQIGGQYQLRDENRYNLESGPTNVSPKSDELAILPERKYRETAAIGFDLYDCIQGSTRELISGPDTGGATPVSVFDRPPQQTFAQVQTIAALGTDVNFGASAAVLGNLLVVGNTPRTAIGSVAIYNYSNGQWNLTQTILDPEASTSDTFGRCVVIFSPTCFFVSSSNFIASTPGNKVYRYTLSGGVWSLAQTLTSPDDPLVSFFGSSMALSGSVLLIGAGNSPNGGQVGEVHYYSLDSNGVATFRQTFKGTDTAFPDEFASQPGSISVLGNLAVIGSRASGGIALAGAAYVFTLSGGTWTQVQKILPPNPGDTSFGWATFIASPSTVFIASQNSAEDITSGDVNIFSVNQLTSQLTLFQRIRPVNPGGGMGIFLTGSDSELYFGEPGVFPGAIFVFTKTGGLWSQAQILAPAVGSGLGLGGLALRGTGQTTPLVTAGQLAFMGVRRKKGQKPQLEAPFKFKPKSMTWIQQISLTAVQTFKVIQPLTDWSFDLYEIRITYSSAQAGLNDPVCFIMPYDGAYQQIANIPFLDQFLNGRPLSEYANGAVVPDLNYPNGGHIWLDLTPIVAASFLPITATVHFIGRNRIPC